MTYAANRIWETSTTTGTGTLDLDGAYGTTWRTFVTALSEDTDEGTGPWAVVYYTIYTLDQNGDYEDVECGYGTVTSGSPDTLTRDNVSFSTNSNALVSFGAGTKYVVGSLNAPALRQFT